MIVAAMAAKQLPPADSHVDPFMWIDDTDDHGKPGIGRIQALADILRRALCCHSNETRAPIANQPNSAQLDATLSFPQVTSGFVQ